MPKMSSKRSVRSCQNCEHPSSRLGRLLANFPSGKRRTLLVCEFCYLQLAPMLDSKHPPAQLCEDHRDETCIRRAPRPLPRALFFVPWCDVAALF